MRLMAVKRALEDAESLIQSGPSDRAIRSLLAVVREHPENLDARWKLSIAQFRCSRFGEAEQQLRTLVDAEPASVRYLNGLGNVLSDREKFDEAEVVYRRAIELAPHDSNLWYNLGNVSLR